MQKLSYQPVVEATRGGIVESVHYGAIAVVSADGRLIASWGDPFAVTFLRSSSKPLQVLPFIEQGGDQKFQLSDKEIAVMCASHSGTEDHVNTIRGVQQRLGIDESELLCGAHAPFDPPSAKALRARGEEPTAIHNNCSGKHTGFLAAATLRKAPHADYTNPAHPIQKTIIQAFAEMTDYPVDKIAVGVDGCSAPVFGLPIYNAAYAFARLADPRGLSPERARACVVITRAMMKHPDMVAGPNRFDTLVMRAAKNKIATKGGAEGYQAIAVMPGALGKDSPALGICYKTGDGDAADRSGAIIGLTILQQLKLLKQKDLEGDLAPRGPRNIKNWAGKVVGELRPCFELDWSALRRWVKS
ncbi:MAG TPA: asparaginase [Bellilinea sp.]|nr:asparaginase [Bellilinea sp.]